ncbi:adenine deaminase [Shouchella shacheensis]|uniref:adenine deaminase n=1 Tax=Shouchella shacheensis TaxID=1649580 RepID=UPI0007401560|nr:adenine deaminase [Shouchella shacheensis]
MTLKTPDLAHKLAVASREKPADLLIKNGKILDMYALQIVEETVAIAGDEIVGIGAYTDGLEVIDASGQYICPGLIDGHVHIESAMVPPETFASVVVPKGVTTVIADPHEIANVGGNKAVQYMVQASKGLPLDVKIMVPSSVPAASFEQNGATLSAEEVEQLLHTDGVYGLGEVMDYPAVLQAEESILQKLEAARANGCVIDGHAAGLGATALNAYLTAGIANDHEAVSEQEAISRVQRGMYVLMREGTAARNLEALLPAVTSANARRFAFATDDKHLDDLIREGSVDANIRKAIALGVEPLQAIQFATLNVAECFKLEEKGAIAPGKEASFLLLSDLESFTVESVYVKGRCVARGGKGTEPLRASVQPPDDLLDSVRVKPFTSEALALPLTEGSQARIIQTNEDSIITEHIVEPVPVEDGRFHPANGYLKLVVAERHKQTGDIGIGIVKGIGITDGAIVSTVAHDSHNIIACGSDDTSIEAAITHVAQMRGGMAVVKGEEVMASLPLELGGLMSLSSSDEVKQKLNELQKALLNIGYQAEKDPFLTLAFLALPVIPSLKLTSKGLFDVETFEFVDVEA